MTFYLYSYYYSWVHGLTTSSDNVLSRHAKRHVEQQRQDPSQTDRQDLTRTTRTTRGLFYRVLKRFPLLPPTPFPVSHTWTSSCLLWR